MRRKPLNMPIYDTLLTVLKKQEFDSIPVRIFVKGRMGNRQLDFIYFNPSPLSEETRKQKPQGREKGGWPNERHRRLRKTDFASTTPMND